MQINCFMLTEYHAMLENITTKSACRQIPEHNWFEVWVAEREL
jgi:hypothetical protein